MKYTNNDSSVLRVIPFSWKKPLFKQITLNFITYWRFESKFILSFEVFIIFMLGIASSSITNFSYPNAKFMLYIFENFTYTSTMSFFVTYFVIVVPLKNTYLSFGLRAVFIKYDPLTPYFIFNCPIVMPF